MGDLTGRVALVTGASRGIGAATARALAAAGAKVFVTDVLDAQAVADEIGGAARKQDVTDEQQWIDTIAWAVAEGGGLDILVNNAGLFLQKATTETTLEEWRRLQSVNVEGVFLGCKHAVTPIAARAHLWAGGGAIINLSSVAGLRGYANSAAYGASKGAVRIMSKDLALEFAPLRVRVNSIHPGVIDTQMGAGVVEGFVRATGMGANEARDTVARLHPLGHFGDVQNIADGIVFLASDKAAFMTGSELVVDGGMTTG
jgi:NAD(P)-dependent dehydrogenase (short-subunit alcohol dehydrogenase family)